MKTMRLLIFGLLISVSHFVNAQARLSVRSSGLPANIHLNDGGVYYDTITIRNVGTGSFTGNIQFHYQINSDTVFTTSPNDTTISYNDQAIDSFGVGDSIQKTLKFFFQGSAGHTGNGGSFMVGPSVVVIWPIVTAPVTLADSAKEHVNVLNPSGINDPAFKNVKAYLANNELIFESDAENSLGRVRIFNVEGAILIDQQVHQTFTTTIPVTQFASGIYLAEVTLTDNRKQVFKLFVGR